MNSYSLDYIDDLYVQYIRDPESVSSSWRRYFEQFSVAADVTRQAEEPDNGVPRTTLAPGGSSELRQAVALAQTQDRINQLVREFRVRGHLIAELDPLGLDRPNRPELNPASYGITEEELSRPLSPSSNLNHVAGKTIGDVMQKLRATYCRSIGAQFMHIDNRNIRDWLQRRMETTENRIQLSHDVQKRIFMRLADASIFEEFVRRKYVGAKTFSLEGAETLIPMLDLALDKAGQHGVDAVVMSMAHRGRLNVLANILKKRALNIFWSFEDPRPDLNRGGGDVRYHLGYSTDWTTSTGEKVHISLCFNPSHLEFVNPVALGRCRSKQDRNGDQDRRRVMPILIHGDAAFAGEGVVQETLNLSELPGYAVGGALHIIINNQIGFTTEADQGRSSTYATDVAKMLQIPIFHVNGEDPEAVAQVVSLAMDFRKEFRRDVVIDLYCYRKWGHNEGDEPRFTQPILYSAIEQRKSVRESYLERLLELGELSEDEAHGIEHERQEKLEREFEASRSEPFVPDIQTLGGCWQDYYGGPEPDGEEIDTTVPSDTLKKLIYRITEVPRDFGIHKKLKRLLQQRREMADGKRPLDWATAEAAAFASLVTSGHPVRVSGQDSERGTFSQRHGVWHDVSSGKQYCPLANIDASQSRMELINSPLSETAVLGYEWGYSLDCPEGLSIWEAQFGDFWNVGQVIVDQFISSAEDKWDRLSSLTMLLPHGFEGQGPEHCSARLERFLSMAAEDNIQVVQPTTPAQFFHVLRRQVCRAWRKPLICMTPKSLLRHPECISSLAELAEGQFKKILPDEGLPLDKAKRVLLCTGKVYFDLLAERKERSLEDEIAIVRIEQLYPLRTHELMDALESLPQGADLCWVQEEPANMGAWPYFKLHYGDDLGRRYELNLISRAESASPSTGSAQAHKLEQQELVDAALTL